MQPPCPPLPLVSEFPQAQLSVISAFRAFGPPIGYKRFVEETVEWILPIRMTHGSSDYLSRVSVIDLKPLVHDSLLLYAAIDHF